MSNGLFLRLYPAAGVQVVPATYGAGKVGYVLGAVVATTFLRSLKLEIRTDGISYANLFRETNFLAFSDISTVVSSYGSP